MRKWIIPDEYFCAILSAMGYGFGYSIPYIFGVPGWICLIICFACGLSLEQLAIKIIYSRYTQEKQSRKLIIFAAFILFFLIGNFISISIFKESLVGNLIEEFGYVLLFEVAGFAISLIRHHYRVKKVKAKYGDGEEGFRFDAEDKAYVESLNRKNAEITGEYDDTVAVKTRTGVYVGEKEKGVLSFYGIPYAKAPVGALRWKAPEILPDSDKVFEAKHFGPSSIQVKYEGNYLSTHHQSEDCLYLNVCTADIAPDEKKPVVVYFYGGDFSFGGAADPLWEIWNFVKGHPDVVAVSFNYRLGLLGFIDFSEIPGGEAFPDTANLGLLDQIAALEWVKGNIAAFGGDPEQITVMGDGAGGISISLLAVCTRAKGLFKKAVIFSGNPKTAQIGGEYSAVLASELLKTADATDMDTLLTLTESELCSLTQKLKAYIATPKCDGKLIPADVFEAYKNGAAKDIQFILAASGDNASAYSASIGRGFSENLFAQTVEAVLHQQKPTTAEKLNRLITDETERIGKAKAEAHFLNLWLDHIGLLQLSEALQSGGGTVRTLFWDVDAVIKNLGISSVNLVSAVLSNLEAAADYGSVINDSVRKVLQTLIAKAILDEAPALYPNEVDGIDAIRWETFPSILVFSKNKIQLQTVEDTLKDAKELLFLTCLEG